MNKAEIDKLVNIWLDVVLSVSHDAGWGCGGSLIYQVSLYHGMPPRGTKPADSDAHMINAIRFLRDPPREYRIIDPVIRVMLRRKPFQIWPLLSKHFYQGLNPRTNRTWTDHDRASYLSQSYPAFRKNLNNAYKTIAADIEVSEEAVKKSVDYG